jgi:hypothetical protein
MRAACIPALLGVALAGAIMSSSGLSAAASPPPSAPGMPQRAEFYRPPEYFQISGTCAAEMTPDQAVILGGVSSASLKPDDAVNQLDQELGLMKSYVAEKHGVIQMMERVRTLKTPQPGKEDIDPPFQVVQRLQIAFPADAPVDAILQKLIELGFDRFGDNVLGNNGNRRETVVRYRATNFEAQFKELENQCIADAWKRWCNPPTANRDCPSQTPPLDLLNLQTFNVRSKESPMRPEGMSAPWQWNVTQGQRPPDPLDLLGNLTLHLEGTVSISYHHPETTNPNPNSNP